MLRRLAFSAAVVLLVSCSPNATCPAVKCKEGITFYVAEVAGALARGTNEPLHICFDGKCQDTTITRANVGGSVFLPFIGVGGAGDHHLTVTGAGAFKGDYTGKLATFTQRPNGAACPGACSLATVKITADGALIPGVPASSTTTTAGATATTAGATATTIAGAKPTAGVTPTTKG